MVQVHDWRTAAELVPERCGACEPPEHSLGGRGMAPASCERPSALKPPYTPQTLGFLLDWRRLIIPVGLVTVFMGR